MLSERSQSALDDLLVTWSWSWAPPPSAPEGVRSEADVFEALASDDEEDIAIWLCDARNLPAAMAEEVVAACRRATKPASSR